MILKNKRKCDGSRIKLDRIALILIIFIGAAEAIYYIFETISYIGESPVIVSLIEEVRVFLLVILSTIAGTDKLNLKKIIAMIVAVISIVGIYFY